jgi:two-component system, response regulator RegA
MITDSKRPGLRRQSPSGLVIGGAPEIQADLEVSARPTTEGTTRLQSVLIVDEQKPFLTSLGTSFREMGFEVWIESSLARAMNVLRTTLPDLVVSEVKLEGQSVLERLPDLRRANPRCLFALVVADPSIQAATAAVRRGVDAYLAKPASASLILGTLAANGCIDSEVAQGLSWPSLDRAIWDYLNQVFLASGSMSEAARRLKVDRRSLRRMLGKQAPA